MNKERAAACVILYHPSSDVIANIKSYSSYVERLYVFDNTEGESYFCNEISRLPNIYFFHDRQNLGIAKRLNAACEMAINDGFQWLLTMDQDSRFTEENISNYLNCFYVYSLKESVGMFGTVVNSNTSAAECAAIEVNELITSGTLLNLSLFKKIGPFDEQLFIDLVDHDYCIRTKLLGFSIIQFANISLTHSLGRQVNRASIKTLFLIKKTKSIHSPLRIYYMYRNVLYLKKKYEGQNIPLVKAISRRVKDSIQKNLLYGRSFVQTFRYLIRAFKDFKRNKMGKYTET